TTPKTLERQVMLPALNLPNIDTTLGLRPFMSIFSDPVNTGTGNYYYQGTDFIIPGRGFALGFRRSYNTLDNYSGPLGANWTHTYNVFLAENSTGDIAIKWDDGHGETFTLNGSTYIPRPGVFSALSKSADGTFLLNQKNQTRYTFSSTGKLVGIQDKNGNTIACLYDGVGNLSQISDTVGRNLIFSYDASNHIAQITDPIGRTVSFQYDATNNLVKATDPAG